MTVAQMHQEFKVLMDKEDSLSYPNFLPENIDVLLNTAQEQIIKQRAFGNNIRRQSVEETQKRLDDLKNITKNFESSTFVSNTNNKPNGVFVELPSDYEYALEEEVIVSYSDCNESTTTNRADVLPITHDRYNKHIKRDPFNKPDKDTIYRLGYTLVNSNEAFELISSTGITITKYFLRYLKEPQTIRYGTTYETPTTDLDCELSDHIHREIIATAVSLALENVESDRYNTYKQELNNIE